VGKKSDPRKTHEIENQESKIENSIMGTLIYDIRFAFRSLLKQPMFAAVAIITLALGIGANTAIFSVVNAALLRRFSYDTTRLVAIDSFNPLKQKRGYGVSPADFWDWKDQSRAFEQLTAYSGGGVGLRESERIEVVSGARVAANFFQTFNVQPHLGRTFAREDGFLSAPPTMVLSHELWQKRFGGDSRIIGRIIKTDDGPVTVIGVMPADFKYPRSAQVWLPLARDSSEMQYRANRYFKAIGRIKSGQTIETAQTELQGVAARLANAFPKENEGWTVQLTDWRESFVRDSRSALLFLMGAVGLVLLIACANVANLLLGRAAARSKEIAIRRALGASRRTLARQLFTESLILGVFGGGLGLLLAVWGVDALTQSLPQLNFTYQSLSELRGEIRIDRAVLLFTVLVSLMTTLLFGLVPGWQAARTDVTEFLKEGSRGSSSGGGHRMRQSLVSVEIALALMLLLGAGLLINSFAHLLRMDPGYDPQGLMVLPLSFPEQNKYAFAHQVMERVSNTPGVSSVALMSYPTLGGLGFPFNRENNPFPNGDVTVAYSAISPSYFQTLKTPLRVGREFNDRDVPNAPKVAVINETLARQYFTGETPIGKKIVIAYLNGRLTVEIVGVVGDVRQEEPSKPIKPEILVPFAQLPWFSGTLLVRSVNPDPLTVKSAVQEAIWSVDPALPESKAEPLTQTLAGQVAEPRLFASLLTVFAVIALTLSAVGIYSVIAYSVTQRTREIGIRLALGAQRRDVLILVAKQGLFLALIGVATGLAGAFALTRLMRTLLFGVTPTDATTFVTISVGLIVVALLACYIPARRATKVDPLVALRYE
jgi:predicted permease